MDSKTIFRKIETTQDIETLVKLADIIWHEHYAQIISKQQIDYMLKRYLTIDAMTEHLNKGSVAKLIEVDNKSVGFFVYDIDDKLLFLDKLYLLKNCRGHGIGRCAFENICQDAKTFGKSGVYLTVNKYNKSSIKAYKAFGLNIEGVAITDIGNNFVMDDYRMYHFFAK